MSNARKTSRREFFRDVFYGATLAGLSASGLLGKGKGYTQKDVDNFNAIFNHEYLLKTDRKLKEIGVDYFRNTTIDKVTIGKKRYSFSNEDYWIIEIEPVQKYKDPKTRLIDGEHLKGFRISAEPKKDKKGKLIVKDFENIFENPDNANLGHLFEDIKDKLDELNKKS